MAKVLSLSSLRNKKSNNKEINQKQKKRNLLNQAFDELNRETGIDHRKVIMGDEKERQKLKMKQYQEALLEG